MPCNVTLNFSGKVRSFLKKIHHITYPFSIKVSNPTTLKASFFLKVLQTIHAFCLIPAGQSELLLRWADLVPGPLSAAVGDLSAL
jgi:hypothetical protein